jgi:hypothetical protein
MKGILEFNLPEEQQEFETAVSAGRMKSLLWDISQEIFRPARKHGYSDHRMKQFLDTDGELKEEVAEAIGVLEQMFYEFVREHNVEID